MDDKILENVWPVFRIHIIHNPDNKSKSFFQNYFTRDNIQIYDVTQEAKFALITTRVKHCLED